MKEKRQGVRNGKSLGGPCHNIYRMCTWYLRRRGKRKRQKKCFEEIMAESLPYLVTSINPVD